MRSNPYRLALMAALTTCLLAFAQEPARDLHGDPLPPGAIARLGTLRFRAADWLTHLAFSPDGKRLVAQSYQSISVWNAESGQKLFAFAGQKVGPVAWRTDGRGAMLVTGDNGRHRIGDFTREKLTPPPLSSPPSDDAATSEMVGNGPPPDEEQISGYAISPNEKILVAGRKGNRERSRFISVGEIEIGKSLADLRKVRELGPQEGNCHQIVFGPDSKFVGIVSGPGSPYHFHPNRSPTAMMTFVLYDLATGEERDHRTISTPRNNGGRLTIATDGSLALTSGNDGAPRLWELSTGKELGRVRLPDDTESLRLAPGDKTLLALTCAKMAAFDLSTGAAFPMPEKMVNVPEGSQIHSGNSRSVLVGDTASLCIWDWPDGRLRRSIDFRKSAEGLKHREPLETGLSTDGKTLIIRTLEGVDSWDAETGDYRTLLQESRDEIGRGFTFLDEGRQLALVSRHTSIIPTQLDLSSRLSLWDLQSGKLLRTFESPNSYWSHGVAADPRGYVLASAEEGDEGFTLIYEIATGQIRRRLPGHANINTAVAFAPDGRRLITVGGDSTGLVWDLSYYNLDGKGAINNERSLAH